MAALVGFRAAENHPITSLAIGNDASLVGNKGNFFTDTVKTGWFNVDDDWVKDIDSLIGTIGHISLNGTIAGSGYVNLKFNQITNDIIEIKLLDRKHLQAEGYQLTETRLTGKIMLNKKNYAPLKNQTSNRTAREFIEIAAQKQ